jgi:hypothetical protein
VSAVTFSCAVTVPVWELPFATAAAAALKWEFAPYPILGPPGPGIDTHLFDLGPTTITRDENVNKFIIVCVYIYIYNSESYKIIS